MSKLLIVEDDKMLNDGIAYALGNDGYDVLQSYNGEQAMRLLSNMLDLVIMDINLPDTNGYELCRQIRNKLNTTVIFLTARDTEQDTIDGFIAGGDDYITKPFSLLILKERIKAVLKRSAANSNLYVCRNLTFDMDKLTLTKDSKIVPLTATEIKLIQLFIDNTGKVLTRAQILERVWDIDGDFVDENTVSVNMSRLRNKLEDNPSKPFFLKTVFGIGYIWGDDR